MFVRLSGFVALFALSACGNQAPEAPLELEWTKGGTWHLAARYRAAGVRTKDSTVSLDGTASDFGDLWSDEVVWTYQVVEQGLVPRQGDELYPFAVTDRGVRSLSVVRASLDDSLNDPYGDLAESDPVVYLVFTERRQRLAGLVAFTNVDGERVEQAYSSKELGRSWSVLSQSMLTAAPTFLAPHGVQLVDGERKLENGHWMSTAVVDDDTVDVVFDDELGGGTVASRYRVGDPWPSWTVAENAEVRLMNPGEVSERRRRAGGEPPENYDYAAALATSVDIDAGTALSESLMNDEVQSFGAPTGYEPWNGSWWAQSKGALVFGYSSRSTLSDRLKDTIDPVRTAMDDLAKELHDLDKDSEEYETKLASYRTNQDELVDQLVAFYDGVLSDLDSGSLTVTDGLLTHNDGWSYSVDELSPMDKVALSMYLRGETYPNPFYIPAWELLNHYSPNGGSWYGHCNGWSAAAILNDEPTEAVVAPFGDGTVTFSTADIKGLLSETHYSTYSHFFGGRYNGDGDDISDLHPDAFHRLITFYMRDQQVPLVFDTDAGEQVWNFPAYGATVEAIETTEGRLDRVNINTAGASALDSLPGIGETLSYRIIDYREDHGPFQHVDELDYVKGIGAGTIRKLADLVTVDPVERTFLVEASVQFATDGVDETHVDDGSPAADGFVETYTYTLVTDAHGQVLGGTWDDEKKHPDFAWIPYANPSQPSGSENPYLSNDALLTSLGDVDPSRL